MQEKYFNINTAGNSIRCKLYFADLKAVKRVVLCVHGFTGHKDNKAVERFADYVLKKHRDVAVIIYNAPCHGDDVKKKLTLAVTPTSRWSRRTSASASSPNSSLSMPTASAATKF